MVNALSDCLASTGAEPVIPLVVSLLLLVAGVAAVLALRRVTRRSGRSGGSGQRPGRGRGSTALGVVLLLLVGIGAGTLSGATPAQAATIGASTAAACVASPTTSPTTPSTSTPTPTATPTPPPVRPAILPDQAVSFASDGVTTYGSYRGPADPSHPVAAAVIIGGTGGIDRNGDAPSISTLAYSWLADLLSAQGIASIRYDKLGTGRTGLGPYSADPAAMLPLSYDQLRIQPARQALSFLAAQPGVDATRLLVVGHSEGGAAALILTTDLGAAPAPAALLLVEPAFAHILDILSREFQDQLEGASQAGAMTTEDAATLSTWMQAGIAEIRTDSGLFPTPGPVPLPAATGFTQLIQTTIQNNVYGSDPAQMVITHAYRTLYGQGYDKVDPAALAPLITIPTLITCGTKDFNTPCGDGTPGSGVVALSSAFAPGVAHFVELPNMVHILRDVGDSDVPNIADQVKYPFSEALATEFSSFAGRFAQTKD